MTDVATPKLEEATRREIAGTCTYFHARRATRILAEAFDDALRPHDLKGTQFTLLVAVSLMEEATVGRLAEAIEPRYRLLVLLAVFGSLRWGELLGLWTPNLSWVKRLSALSWLV